MFRGLKNLLFGASAQSTSSSGNSRSVSKSLAKSRLHFVLVQDRTGLSTDDMTNFKREMVEVIERYFVIEDRELDISYKRDTESTTLLINSPVRVRRADEMKKKANKPSAEKVAKGSEEKKEAASKSEEVPVAAN